MHDERDFAEEREQERSIREEDVMSSKHTPGPWKTHNEPGIIVQNGSAGYDLVSWGPVHDGAMGSPANRAIAADRDRIVECVNACEPGGVVAEAARCLSVMLEWYDECTPDKHVADTRAALAAVERIVGGE